MDCVITDKELVRLYRKMPHELYAPVHQLFEPEKVMKNPIPQKFSVTDSNIIKTESEDREFFDLLGEILEKSESDDPGARILVEGQAGMGKTWMMSNLAKEWADSYNKSTSILKKFNQVYFIPVRHIKNHAENIERIICNDLKMLPPHILGSGVRQQIEFNDSQTLFLIDGYDEKKDNMKKTPTINALVKGDIAPKATVIVTTRPHGTEQLKDIMKHNKARLCVTIQKLHYKTIQKHLRNEFPDMTLEELINTNLEDTMMGKPLYMSVQFYIWKCRKRAAGSTYNTKTSVLDALWGIMLGVKDDKEGKNNQLIFYESLRDDKVSDDVRQLVAELAEIAFKLVEIKSYSFKHPSLLSELGGSLAVIDVHTDGICQFVHNIFLEHCAALHLLINHHQPLLFLRQYQPNVNILKYVVGMEPSILQDIATQMYKPLEAVDMYDNSLLDVNLHHEILTECQDKEITKLYGKTLAMQPIKTHECGKYARFTENDKVESRPAYVMRLIGRDTCLVLLQGANPESVFITDNTNVIQVATDWKGEFNVSSSMVLALLYSMDINKVIPLHLHNVDQDVLQLTKEWTVSLYIYPLDMSIAYYRAIERKHSQ